MDLFTVIILAIFVLVAGRLIYGRFRHGSWTGSFVKGRIDRTVGEVTLSSGLGATQTIAVHAMRGEAGEDGFVALVFVAKAPLGASMQPHRLTKSQARELADLLARAAT